MSNKVVVTRTWGEYDLLQIIVVADSAYPDALSEARLTALNAFREAHGVTITAEAPE